MSFFCVVLGKTFGNETVRTPEMPKQPIALSVVSINIDQEALDDVLEGKRRIRLRLHLG